MAIRLAAFALAFAALRSDAAEGSLVPHAPPDVRAAVASYDGRYTNLCVLLPRMQERDRIQAHLTEIEGRLRRREVKKLTPEAARWRRRLLDRLHTYRTAGKFPANEVEGSGRHPIFRDRHGTWCAVADLIVASGHGSAANEIASYENSSTVDDMNAKELDEWLRKHGFTREECAWIQPSYQAPDPVVEELRGVIRRQAGLGMLSGLAVLVLGGVIFFGAPLPVRANKATRLVAISLFLLGALIFLYGYAIRYDIPPPRMVDRGFGW